MGKYAEQVVLDAVLREIGLNAYVWRDRPDDVRRAASALAKGQHRLARRLLAEIGVGGIGRNKLLLGDSPQAKALVEASIELHYFSSHEAGREAELLALIRMAGLRFVKETGELLPLKGADRDT